MNIFFPDGFTNKQDKVTGDKDAAQMLLKTNLNILSNIFTKCYRSWTEYLEARSGRSIETKSEKLAYDNGYSKSNCYKRRCPCKFLSDSGDPIF